MSKSTKRVMWQSGLSEQGLEILKADGGMIVCPTKVGYIVMTSDYEGLKRKFDAKNRNLNKPGVVLCGSMEQLKALAQLNPEIESFYQAHWDKDILLGCILPWKKEAVDALPEDGRKDLMMDNRGTSCFVIKFGTPGEQIAKALWDEGKMAFASSANPSGKGNRGLIEGIGDRIENAADLIIEANDYVASIQPNASLETRYEQGVMVSMVDEEGNLIPEQKGERSISPAPIVIRKGIYINDIMFELSEHFTSWNYRQGEYY